MAATTGSGIHVALDELIALGAFARGAELAVRRATTATSGGGHHSRWRGRGIDFRESRAYQPGDEIRHMDWRVTARTGRPHTKLFEEEREQGLLLAVDLNPSLHFGTRVRFKSVQAARAAALLAWIVAQHGDRVGALGFGGGVDGEIKPAGGRRGVLRVLRALRDWDHAADIDRNQPLSSALQRMRRLLKPGMRLVIVSDGFSADAAALPLLTRIAERHEISAVIVSDAIERVPPPPGRYAISLAGKRRLLDFGEAKLRSDWTRNFTERRARLLEQLSRARARVAEISTDGDLVRGLAPLFAGATVRSATTA